MESFTHNNNPFGRSKPQEKKRRRGTNDMITSGLKLVQSKKTQEVDKPIQKTSNHFYFDI